MVDLPDRVRAACARVAARARHVRIDAQRIAPYAAALPATADVPGPDPTAHYFDGPPEAVSAFILCLDAINFGSGWWPTVRKRNGRSGYLTMASGLADRFRARGPWTAEELAGIELREIAEVLGQDPEHELMPLYAAALRDLGQRVAMDMHGRFAAVAESADESAVVLATRLSGWNCFSDTSTYDELEVPFFKRAQLACADLQAAGVARFGDVHRLTAFADNLVPHLLALDGVLNLDRDLARRIEAGELLVHDSPEEVELRACALHAVELLSEAAQHRLCPAEIDMVLWTRGQEPRAKARPRPRSRTTAY
ncbi:MAG: queuosine salvage family protein [Actinomycetota bacterium]|nr:queuosine salvage family protein [Actinomycetota bacterium]